jgi:hypothetical protein
MEDAHSVPRSSASGRSLFVRAFRSRMGARETALDEKTSPSRDGRTEAANVTLCN